MSTRRCGARGLERTPLGAGSGAMLIAFIALVAMINGLLGWLGALVGAPGVTLEGL